MSKRTCESGSSKLKKASVKKQMQYELLVKGRNQ